MLICISKVCIHLMFVTWHPNVVANYWYALILCKQYVQHKIFLKNLEIFRPFMDFIYSSICIGKYSVLFLFVKLSHVNRRNYEAHQHAQSHFGAVKTDLCTRVIGDLAKRGRRYLVLFMETRDN